MTAPCGVALKEWATICAALASGRQAILLRKGGLIERDGTFALEHETFWLYPTYLHQQEQGVAPAWRSFLTDAEADKPPAGTVRLSLLAEVAAAWHLETLAAAEALADWHAWTAETIASRFAYRRPGLTLLALRVWRAETAHAVTETAEQAGCRSWVPLAEPLAPGEALPVLENSAATALFMQLAAILTATGGASRLSTSLTPNP